MANLLSNFQENGKYYKETIILVVYIALFLDNMLVTVVVPIMPSYLRKLYSTPKDNVSLELNTRIMWKNQAENSTLNYSSPNFDYVNLTSAQNETNHGEIIEANSFADEAVWVGLMFGSKAFIQLLTNPIVGPLTNRIGYKIPMFAGFVIMFTSTLIFAFGKTYTVLVIARACQGAGSACTTTSGLGMLAKQYTDKKERGAKMGLALGGLALGIVVGPPFGGFLYEYYGKALPFILLAMLALIDGVIQYVCLQPRIEKEEVQGASIFSLLADPYICVAAGAIATACFGVAILEPTLPLWMMETMNANAATVGFVYLPISVCYLLGVHIFSPIGHKFGRWLLSTLALAMCGISMTCIPFAENAYHLLAPNAFLGFGLGIFDAMIFPEMGNLVDLRHVGIYGSVYSIADGAVCCAFAFGPFISGALVEELGFPLLVHILGGITLIYAPLIIFLRCPGVKVTPSSEAHSNALHMEQ